MPATRVFLALRADCEPVLRAQQVAVSREPVGPARRFQCRDPTTATVQKGNKSLGSLAANDDATLAFSGVCCVVL